MADPHLHFFVRQTQQSAWWLKLQPDFVVNLIVHLLNPEHYPGVAGSSSITGSANRSTVGVRAGEC